MNRHSLDGLLALKAVAEKRNFRLAAVALGVSPSALSQTINQLEGRLGIALLSRTTRATQLTEAGGKFLEKAGPAMDRILEAVSEVGSYAEKPSGLLRINTLRYAYPSFLDHKVISFMKKFPEVSVEVVLDDELSDVLEKRFDAGIRLSDILAKDVIAVKLFGPIQWVVAGSPGYFREHPHPARPRDLLSHNCIRVRSGDVIHDRWEFTQAGKMQKVQVRGSLLLNDPLLAIDAASADAGLVYATGDLVRERVEAGILDIVLEGFCPTSSGYYLYYPSRSQVQPKLRAFIDHLKTGSSRIYATKD